MNPEAEFALSFLYQLCVPHRLYSRNPSVRTLDKTRSVSRPFGQAENGGLFVYDLLQSPVIPVASAYLPADVADLSRSGAVGIDKEEVANSGAIYSVAFNPKQRDLLATGDCYGRVIVWRVSWRLANKRPGESDTLEKLFKGSVNDVSVGVAQR